MRAHSRKAPAEPPNFVFKGTIRQIGASNVRQAPANNRTAIVTVIQVIEAPPNLARYAGQEITVELHNPRAASSGDTLIFHAISWLTGESIAVTSLFEERASDDAKYARALAEPTQSHQREMRAHFHAADMVISGKVIEVRLPKAQTLKAKRSAATGIATTRVSEHDPKWREAVVKVDEVHKGEKSKRQIIIRFPSSRDVAWRRAPKFQPGQEGYFMLHKEKRSRAGTGGGKSRRSPSSVQAFTVRDRDDFQPYSEAGGMKSLIESGVFRNKT